MTQKTLYLCRGLPGSGKTTLAKLIAPDYHYASDDYWDETGIAFNTGQLPDAHQQCIDRVNSAMELGANPIAVHNTLSESWEATRYFLVAEKHGYSVFVIECQNDFGSVHDVPHHIVRKMEWRWERRLKGQPSRHTNQETPQ